MQMSVHKITTGKTIRYSIICIAYIIKDQKHGHQNPGFYHHGEDLDQKMDFESKPNWVDQNTPNCWPRLYYSISKKAKER